MIGRFMVVNLARWIDDYRFTRAGQGSDPESGESVARLVESKRVGGWDFRLQRAEEHQPRARPPLEAGSALKGCAAKRLDAAAPEDELAEMSRGEIWSRTVRGSR